MDEASQRAVDFEYRMYVAEAPALLRYVFGATDLWDNAPSTVQPTQVWVMPPVPAAEPCHSPWP